MRWEKVINLNFSILSIAFSCRTDCLVVNLAINFKIELIHPHCDSTRLVPSSSWLPQIFLMPFLIQRLNNAAQRVKYLNDMCVCVISRFYVKLMNINNFHGDFQLGFFSILRYGIVNYFYIIQSSLLTAKDHIFSLILQRIDFSLSHKVVLQY